MEQVGFSRFQRHIFDKFSQNDGLRERFYFTGGTALSTFHLAHRLSEDMDFFSEEDFDNELVYPFVSELVHELGLQESFTQIERVRVFELVKGGTNVAKIDFAYYPFKRLIRGEKVQGVEVDSFTDIAVNKLLTVNQRKDIKDFVDLYFILNQKPPKVSVWDLLEGVKRKFGFEIDPILVAADFMKVEEFDFLPKMILPLEVSDLHEYFRQRAKEIAEEFVE